MLFPLSRFPANDLKSKLIANQNDSHVKENCSEFNVGGIRSIQNDLYVKIPSESDPETYNEWRNYDNLFKILIIGNSAVGKTAFLTRFTDDIFNSGFCSTIGIDFRIKTVHKDGRKIKLQVNPRLNIELQVNPQL